MFDIFAMTHWSWLIIGLVLLVCELVAPFAFFLWIGLAAIVTALAVFIVPGFSWQGQFFLFSVLSVVSVVLSHKYLLNSRIKSELPNLNRRGQQYIGRTFTLVEGIRNGYGKINVDDSRWQVVGPALEKGEAVKVVGLNGSVFEVEAADSSKANSVTDT